MRSAGIALSANGCPVAGIDEANRLAPRVERLRKVARALHGPSASAWTACSRSSSTRPGSRAISVIGFRSHGTLSRPLERAERLRVGVRRLCRSRANQRERTRVPRRAAHLQSRGVAVDPDGGRGRLLPMPRGMRERRGRAVVQAAVDQEAVGGAHSGGTGQRRAEVDSGARLASQLAPSRPTRSKSRAGGNVARELVERADAQRVRRRIAFVGTVISRVIVAKPNSSIVSVQRPSARSAR